MLKKLNIWVDVAHMRKLTALARIKGLKAAQLVRLAIAEYLERNGQ